MLRERECGGAHESTGCDTPTSLTLGVLKGAASGFRYSAAWTWPFTRAAFAL
jgi:hypothetical protein